MEQRGDQTVGLVLPGSPQQSIHIETEAQVPQDSLTYLQQIAPSNQPDYISLFWCTCSEASDQSFRIVNTGERVQYACISWDLIQFCRSFKFAKASVGDMNNEQTSRKILGCFKPWFCKIRTCTQKINMDDMNLKYPWFERTQQNIEHTEYQPCCCILHFCPIDKNNYDNNLHTYSKGQTRAIFVIHNIHKV